MKQYISSLPIEMAMTKAGNIFGLNLYLLTETNPVNMAYNGYNIETSIPLTYDPEELSKFEYFFSVTWPNFWGSPRGKLLAFVLFIVALALSFITGTYAFFMFTLKISTIFLLAGAAISGVTSLIKGGSFGDEFVEYINNNWAQSLAITSALFIISVGVSSIVKLAKPQCFKAGTKVLTSEGNKNIEDVKVGDKVWSYNEETKEKELKEVVRLYRNGEEYTTNDDIGEGVKEWIKVGISTLNNNDLITCTAGHPFYVLNASSYRDTIIFNKSNEKNQQLEGSWIASKDLKVGDELLLSNGENAIISSVEVEYLEKPEAT